MSSFVIQRMFGLSAACTGEIKASNRERDAMVKRTGDFNVEAAYELWSWARTGNII